MRPRNFQVAVRYRLGVPVVSSPFPCPLCEQSFDIRGDHAACCTRTGDVVVRHNRIRNLLDRVCHEGLLEPQLEKKGILGPTSGRRPGDVTLPIWADGKGLAIDVAVTSPYSVAGLRSSSPADNYATNHKHSKYESGFVGSGFSFCAMVFETTGGVCEEGSGVLKQIFRFAARNRGTTLSVYAGRAWARLSCNLQTSVSQAILNRVSGFGSEFDASEGSSASSSPVPPPGLPTFFFFFFVVVVVASFVVPLWYRCSLRGPPLRFRLPFLLVPFRPPLSMGHLPLVPLGPLRPLVHLGPLPRP